MSDTQRDREERQHVIKVLKNMLDWMEAANLISSKPERIEAVKYAIASIETDLKYDLLYEETSEQADKPITKNCESCRYYGSHHKVCNYCYKCSLWTEQESTNKNDLGVDYISRDSAIKALGYDIKSFEFKSGVSKYMDDIAKLLDIIYEIQVNNIKALPSVTPQKPQSFKWCTDCKEYDQEKHCCHRYSKVIRDTVAEIEQESSRNMEEIEEVINCDADAETKCKMISNILTAKLHYFEEPFINKPCVSSEVCEHDKQKILDKIRAEIEIEDLTYYGCEIHPRNVIDNILKIIDKYKAESEKE